jgi:hypothetical protein
MKFSPLRLAGELIGVADAGLPPPGIEREGVANTDSAAQTGSGYSCRNALGMTWSSQIRQGGSREM